MALSDRILVMHDGRIVGEVPEATSSEQTIGLMMAGVPETQAATDRHRAKAGQ